MSPDRGGLRLCHVFQCLWLVVIWGMGPFQSWFWYGWNGWSFLLDWLICPHFENNRMAEGVKMDIMLLFILGVCEVAFCSTVKKDWSIDDLVACWWSAFDGECDDESCYKHPIFFLSPIGLPCYLLHFCMHFFCLMASLPFASWLHFLLPHGFLYI